MATVGELQRQIGLLDRLVVELFDGQGHVLDADLELGVEWPYVRKAPGSWTVAQWQRERLAPLRPDLVVWVMGQKDEPAPDGRTLKKVRAYRHPQLLEDLIGASHKFNADLESVVVVIGDRDADISGVHLGEAVTAQGSYGLAFRLTRYRQSSLTIWVHNGRDVGPQELLEVTLELPSRVLRIGRPWHLAHRHPLLEADDHRRRGACWCSLHALDRRRSEPLAREARTGRRPRHRSPLQGPTSQRARAEA